LASWLSLLQLTICFCTLSLTNRDLRVDHVRISTRKKSCPLVPLH
jgi:hypothetical protein